MIVAFDPGETTGWARLDPVSLEFRSGQLPWYSAWYWFNDTLSANPAYIQQVVCEDFIYTAETAKKSRQTWSTEGIGVVRFLCQYYGLPLTIQSPSSAKSFATDKKLKRIGWYTPTKGGHANDAARHLMVFAVSNGVLPLERFRPEEEENAND